MASHEQAFSVKNILHDDVSDDLLVDSIKILLHQFLNVTEQLLLWPDP